MHKRFLKAITKHLSDLGIELVNGRFCMDTTNVNSGGKSGMKHLLQHAIPRAVWIDCGIHKVALSFKHLLQVYPDVLAADATLLALWKFFHYQRLATNLLRMQQRCMMKSRRHQFAHQSPDRQHMIKLVRIFAMILNKLCRLLQEVSMKGRNQMLLVYLWR